jgi:hypothetical protein
LRFAAAKAERVELRKVVPPAWAPGRGQDARAAGAVGAAIRRGGGAWIGLIMAAGARGSVA